MLYQLGCWPGNGCGLMCDKGAYHCQTVNPGLIDQIAQQLVNQVLRDDDKDAYHREIAVIVRSQTIGRAVKERALELLRQNDDNL